MIFRPSIKLSLALALLAFVFLRLGFWQLERKAEKTRLFEQFDNAPTRQIGPALLQGRRFTRVEAYGHYDPARHVLLDNKIFNGRAGVHVLTPFMLQDGRQILVNRGWLPLPPDRRSLPQVHSDDELRIIRGRLNTPSTGGPRIGDADTLVRDNWPQLVTYLDLDSVAEVLDVPLEPWLLQLDPQDDSGFEDRQWRAAFMGPEIHSAYAFQWFSIAAATLIIWITLGVRRAQLLSKNPPGN